MPFPEPAIGVDLGGTKMLVGVVGEGRRILHRRLAPSGGLDAAGLLDLLEAELREALRAVPEAASIGLGIPCTIDQRRGVGLNAVNLPIHELPIRDEVRGRLGLPVAIDNDASVAIVAEHRFGAARGTRNAVMLTIGTGIGGGLVLGGELYRGTNGAGSELGHVVIDLDGPRCQGSCPSRGCVEAVASGTALAREGREAAEREPGSALGEALAAGREVDGELITEAARAGDRTAGGVLELIGRRIGVALASLANIFEPEVIVLGGGVMEAGELLLEPARAELRARALPPHDGTPVRVAELGPEAGMIGAATIAAAELESA